jgi:hypothetical protein
MQDIDAVEREERSERLVTIKWEYIVIIVLGFLLITFFLIIILLLWKIHTLKNAIQMTSDYVPSAITQNLYTEHTVKMKDLSQPFVSVQTQIENPNLQLYDSSSDISSARQCCSDKHTDLSFCSESSDSGHTSVFEGVSMGWSVHRSMATVRRFTAERQVCMFITATLTST